MPPIASHIRSYELNDETAVFDEQRQRLFVLNESASYVWRLTEAGYDSDRAVADLVAATGSARSGIAADVLGLLDDWRSHGLLGAKPKLVDARVSRSSASAQARLQPLAHGVLESAAARRRSFRLMGYDFAVESSNDSVDRSVSECLGHLEIPAASAPRNLDRFELIREDRRWRLLRNGTEINACRAKSGALPLLHSGILMSACEQSDALCLVHAAAVSRGQECLLLPGESGSGKSTLTAALVASGFGFCADDVAPLTPPPVRLMAAPVRIGIKNGSCPALKPSYPLIDALPSHRRADRRIVRYLLPAADCLPALDDTFSVRFIVFPRFIAGSPTRLKPIKCGESLLRLTRAGYDMPQGMNDQAVHELVEWIGSTDSYELIFGDRDGAVDAIRQLFA